MAIYKRNDWSALYHKTFKQLYKERPVLKQALCHSLNHILYTTDIIHRQNELLTFCGKIYRNESFDDFELDKQDIIIITLCITETLYWIANHPCHQWREPLLRLYDVMCRRKNVKIESEKDLRVFK